MEVISWDESRHCLELRMSSLLNCYISVFKEDDILLICITTYLQLKSLRVTCYGWMDEPR